MNKFLDRNFYIFILLIVLIAIFLGFYNYNERFGFAYDQVHDAIVARYAVFNHKIPLVGPFSSGARFQTSGIWYWFLMFSTGFYSFSFLSPWVSITLLYVIFVGLITIVASKVIDKPYGVLVGILTVFSTAQITQATNLTLTAPMALVSLGAIYASFLYVRFRSLKTLFFLGFFCGLSPTIHLQGVPLVLLLPVSILFTRTKNPKYFLIALVGFIIPFIPLIIFDLENNFVNAKGLIDQILSNQFNVSYEVLGRRWFTYLSIYWPRWIGLIVGGYSFISYILGASFLFVFFYNFKKKRIKLEWLIFFTTFFLTVVILRYIRTPLFDSYFVFLHPFILFFTGWVIYYLFKINHIFAILLIALVLTFTIKRDINEIQISGNTSFIQSNARFQKLLQIYPNGKFSVYSYKYHWAGENLSLVLLLYSKGYINDNGRKIGITYASRSGEFNYPVIEGSFPGLQLLDLSGSSSAELGKNNWGRVNPVDIYKATENWYKR